MTNLFNLILASAGDISKVVEPINTLIESVIPVLLGVVGSLGSIYCIFLGVKYAKADDPQEHEKAKKGLKNAIVGFVLIFVLLVVLNLGLIFFQDWYINQL